MEILISNRQTDVPLKAGHLKKLARQVLELEQVVPSVELSIAFVSRGEIKELNLRYRKVDAPTDVLAFSLEAKNAVGSAANSGLARVLGDVVISPAVALEQAGEYQTSVEEEIRLLLVHGILHLLGYDHERPDEAKTMRAREEEILRLTG